MKCYIYPNPVFEDKFGFKRRPTGLTPPPKKKRDFSNSTAHYAHIFDSLVYVLCSTYSKAHYMLYVYT